MSGLSETQILEHLQTRREYGHALLELSQRQRGYIANREFSELIDVLSRKQRILGRLDALKQQQPAVVEEWNRRREQFSATVRTRCESLLQETESLFAQLLAEEQSCTEALQQSRDEVRRELDEISNSQEAHRAYGTGVNPETSVLDIGL